MWPCGAFLQGLWLAFRKVIALSSHRTPSAQSGKEFLLVWILPLEGYFWLHSHKPSASVLSSLNSPNLLSIAASLPESALLFWTVCVKMKGM